MDFLGVLSSPFSAAAEASFSETMEKHADPSWAPVKGPTRGAGLQLLQPEHLFETTGGLLRPLSLMHRPPAMNGGQPTLELGSLDHSGPLCPAGAQAGSCFLAQCPGPAAGAREVAHKVASVSAGNLKDMGERTLVPEQGGGLFWGP